MLIGKLFAIKKREYITIIVVPVNITHNVLPGDDLERMSRMNGFQSGPEHHCLSKLEKTLESFNIVLKPTFHRTSHTSGLIGDELEYARI